MTKLKYICQIANGDRLPKNDRRGEVPVYGSNGPYATTSQPNTTGPAIIIGRKGAAGVIHWVEDPCFVSDTAFFIDQSYTKHHLRWLFWSLHSLDFDQLITTSIIPGLSRNTLYDVDLCLPPIEMQREIARCLDRGTQHINELVTVQKRILSLIHEKREVLLSNSVTQGLRANIPLQETRHPLLKCIPAHWEIMRLREMMFAIDQGSYFKTENRIPGHGEWGILSPAALASGHFDESKVKVLAQDKEPRTELELKPGDFLITNAGSYATLGRSCFFPEVRPKRSFSNLIYRIRLNHAVLNGDFLAAYLSSTLGSNQILADARGSNINRLNQKSVINWPIPVPPLEEQIEIAHHLQTEFERLAALELVTERTIRLCEERRKVLIDETIHGHQSLEHSA